jgi:hypothetical protein
MAKKGVCSRGYNAAKALHYPFPSTQALNYARQVCDGNIPDLMGIYKVNPDTNYITTQVSKHVNGFSRRQAEQWIDVCNKQRCDNDSKNCRPSARIDDNTSLTIRQMSEQQIEELCSNYRPSYPNATELKLKLVNAGLKPIKQVTVTGQTIGIVDSQQLLHVCRPSDLLPELDIVVLSDGKL